MENFENNNNNHFEQIDVLVASLQEIDLTNEGREALVSVEAHVTGGLI